VAGASARPCWARITKNSRLDDAPDPLAQVVTALLFTKRNSISIKLCREEKSSWDHHKHCLHTRTATHNYQRSGFLHLPIQYPSRPLNPRRGKVYGHTPHPPRCPFTARSHSHPDVLKRVVFSPHHRTGREDAFNTTVKPGNRFSFPLFNPLEWFWTAPNSEWRKLRWTPRGRRTGASWLASGKPFSKIKTGTKPSHFVR